MCDKSPPMSAYFQKKKSETQKIFQFIAIHDLLDKAAVSHQRSPVCMFSLENASMKFSGIRKHPLSKT